MRSSVKMVIHFFIYCLISSVVWHFFNNSAVGYSDYALINSRVVLLLISVFALFMYGALANIKLDKSFLVSQIIIFLITIFCVVIALSNKEFFKATIQQSTPDNINVVPELVFYLCMLIIEPFSAFIWKAMKAQTENYWIALTSVIPVVSIALGMAAKKFFMRVKDVFS